MLRLDNYLNTHPWIVLVCGVILSIVTVFLRGRIRKVFLAGMILFILYMTMVYRETGESRGAFELFWSYKDFFFYRQNRQDIINNIWLFVPLGALLYSSSHPNRWIWAVLLSVLIEAVQWFAGIGLADFDDVLSNGLGAMIGFLFAAGIPQALHKSWSCWPEIISTGIG